MAISMSDRSVSFAQQMSNFLRQNLNWFLALGLALLLLQDVFGTHGLLAMRRAQKEAANVQREIDQINLENRRLQENVKALKTDPAAIERIAREEMGLARPGEYIFKIPAKPGDAPALVSPPSDSAAKP